MDKAQGCLVWLMKKIEASEETYLQKLNQLERESGKVVASLNNNYGASKVPLETCFSSGDRCLNQSDIPGAYEWFYKVFKEAGTKEKETRYQAVLRIGLASRKYANNDSVEKKIKEKFIYKGASLLVFELKAGVMSSDHLLLGTRS